MVEGLGRLTPPQIQIRPSKKMSTFIIGKAAKDLCKFVEKYNPSPLKMLILRVYISLDIVGIQPKVNI